MVRWVLIPVTVIAVMLGLTSACAAPTPETIEKEVVKEVPVEEAVEVEKEVEVPDEEAVEVEKEVVTFMVWPADDFEEQALEKMVERFQEIHPGIKVEMIVLR